MRKKQSNLFYTSPKISSPPFMTAEELREFKTQFTLFHSELDLQKLKEQLYHNDLAGNGTKYLEVFLNSIQQEHEKVSFEAYIEELVTFLQKQDQAELIINMLGGEEKLLSKNLIREVIEETMDRDLSAKEEAEILNKIFQADSETPECIGKNKILQILQQRKDKN